MIGHLAEVFIVIAAAFGLGCFIGALVHGHFAAGRHGARQEGLANGLGDVFGATTRGIGVLAAGASGGVAALFKAKRRPLPSAPPVSQFPGPLKTHEEAKVELEEVLASLKAPTGDRVSRPD